jgi:general stress protein CsbA
MTAGGILCLTLILHHHYGLTSSFMLIFYGIALINVSSYTYSNTRYLGYVELLLGLADSFVEGYALLFWTLGFGVCHIVYGFFFYMKYDREKKKTEGEVAPEYADFSN